jgi:hypothetical protein
MDEIQKARLLDTFQQYLEALDTAEPGTAGPEIDLFSFFNELAALRTEVKTESRWFRSTLDDLREAHASLQLNQTTLDQTLDRFRNELTTLRRAALRPVLLDLLDVYDRLAAGAAALGHNAQCLFMHSGLPQAGCGRHLRRSSHLRALHKITATSGTGAASPARYSGPEWCRAPAVWPAPVPSSPNQPRHTGTWSSDFRGLAKVR